eukprot:m.254128 g.254128  ORF g.254128 m.254128 type:complete len:114 (-) comp26537_c0_seq4:327-668(-)
MMNSPVWQVAQVRHNAAFSGSVNCPVGHVASTGLNKDALNTRKIPAIFTRLNLMVKRVMMCARACVCTRCLAKRTCTCVFGKCLQRPWCRNWDTPPPSVETERVSSTQLHAGQ